MLKLLLDEHISPAVAIGLRRRNPKLTAHSLQEWHGGDFLGQDDEACLKEAARQRLTLVTYDLRTIPPLLKSWAEQHLDHGGVIFIDEKTIAPAEIGALVRALDGVARATRTLTWTNRIVFLHR
jgi:hypothetical protein